VEDLGSVTIQDNRSGKGCGKKLRSSDLAVLWLSKKHPARVLPQLHGVGRVSMRGIPALHSSD